MAAELKARRGAMFPNRFKSSSDLPPRAGTRTVVGGCVLSGRFLYSVSVFKQISNCSNFGFVYICKFGDPQGGVDASHSAGSRFSFKCAYFSFFFFFCQVIAWNHPSAPSVTGSLTVSFGASSSEGVLQLQLGVLAVPFSACVGVSPVICRLVR